MPKRKAAPRVRRVWPGRPFPLGATYDGAGTNFSLYSEVADGVELCLFDDHTEERIPLTEQTALWLDRTLGGLSVSPPLTRIGRGGRLTASFTLTRPARLTGTLRTRSGAVVATFTRAAQAQAGPNAIRWNGKAGKRWVPSGRYLVRIRAVSTVGASELQAPVTIRRVAPARAPKRG